MSRGVEVFQVCPSSVLLMPLSNVHFCFELPDDLPHRSPEYIFWKGCSSLDDRELCLPHSVTHTVYFLYTIVVSVGVMQLIPTAGFKEEEDASALMFPFSAIWQSKLQLSIYRVKGDVKHTENTSLRSKPSCSCLTLLCETPEPKLPTNQHTSTWLV